jgi:4-amino-4-deoxy-L-arabinose transferase
LLHSLVSKRVALALLCGAALYFLYFFGLTRTGLLGPDEPRYAAVGRAMAQTGDWITPRLWGQPWFEKPALLYWMTALGFKAGLGPDLAPRLPVALASAAFLICFFIVLHRQFGARAAFYATATLATSAGWLAYSRVAVTDLPMSAAFAAAMLLIMKTSTMRSDALIAGALLGLAVLAKGLVPLVLFLPALWFLRDRIRYLALLFVATAVVALPWYVLVTLRNGAPFLEDFFWKQHFQRFTSNVLQHQQPFWYYLPVLVAGFFPWCPLLLLLFQRPLYKDRRAIFLLAWLLWGFLFFSISRNKLPGYLLPLMPAAAALLGIAIARARAASSALALLFAATALLLCFVPAILHALPQALLTGVSHAHLVLPLTWIAPAAIAAVCCLFLEKAGRRFCAFTVVTVLAFASTIQIVWRAYPQLDRSVSARSIPVYSVTCVDKSNRSRRYGLQYYADRTLPDCN